MSLSVQSLNGDSTFLLTFETSSSDDKFTILVDPWLAGASTIWNSQFSEVRHRDQPSVSSLAELPLPDIILISQDKNDHCHQETLRSLPANSPVHFVATPAAAKKISSWRYFTHATITPLPIYNPKSRTSVLRLPTPAGEFSITFIPQSWDMTSLHHAIGLTFHPKIHSLPANAPPTPPESPAASLELFPLSRPLSVLYAPHGIGLPCITPYMTQHLAPMSALPLTALFHCLTVERNPWFLGGTVCPGLPGAMNLLKNFGARYWLSAHDEVKDAKGWATAMIAKRIVGLAEAQEAVDGEKTGTRVVGLGIGEGITVGS